MVKAPMNERRVRARNYSETLTNRPSLKPHIRGDKIVANGARESLKAIVNKYVCQCGKHRMNELMERFLSQHKINSTYDATVW